NPDTTSYFSAGGVAEEAVCAPAGEAARPARSNRLSVEARSPRHAISVTERMGRRRYSTIKALLLGRIYGSLALILSDVGAGRAVRLDGIDAVESSRPVRGDRMKAIAEGLKERRRVASILSMDDHVDAERLPFTPPAARIDVGRWVDENVGHDEAGGAV